MTDSQQYIWFLRPSVPQSTKNQRFSMICFKITKCSRKFVKQKN